MADQPQRNPSGTAALVIAIIGIPLFWMPFVNLLCPALSVIFGLIGLHRARRTGTGKLPAVTGIVLGGILFPIGLFVIDVVMTLGTVLSASGGVTP